MASIVRRQYGFIAASLLILGLPEYLAAQERIVLSDVTSVDPAETLVTRPHVDVVVSREKILSVRPHQAESDSAHVRVLNLSGAFVLPGFIDTHAHTLLSPRASDGRILPKPRPASTEWLRDVDLEVLRWAR